VDGSIWYTVGVFGGSPGFLRYDPKAQLSEVFYMPRRTNYGYGIRGGDIDKNGVAWGSGSGGDLVSFDRRKCKGKLNGPAATGDHCPEGWTFYRYPGPSFEGLEGSVEASYYLGGPAQHARPRTDIPMSTRISMTAVAPKDGKMVMLRIPYPMGFYAGDLTGGSTIRTLARGQRSGPPMGTALADGNRERRARAVHIQLRPIPGCIAEGRNLLRSNEVNRSVIRSFWEAPPCASQDQQIVYVGMLEDFRRSALTPASAK
jgi:hypothetical protein